MLVLFFSEFILVSTKMMNGSGMGRVLTEVHWVCFHRCFHIVVGPYHFWQAAVGGCEYLTHICEYFFVSIFFSGIKQWVEKGGVQQRCSKNLGQRWHENAELLTCKCTFIYLYLNMRHSLRTLAVILNFGDCIYLLECRNCQEWRRKRNQRKRKKRSWVMLTRMLNTCRWNVCIIVLSEYLSKGLCTANNSLTVHCM